MNWREIPLVVRGSVATVIVVMGALGYLSTYQTDAEAAQYQAQHANELRDVRIQQIALKISDYEFMLLDQGLSQEKRDWIDRQIKKLNKQIECIRKGEC